MPTTTQETAKTSEEEKEGARRKDAEKGGKADKKSAEDSGMAQERWWRSAKSTHGWKERGWIRGPKQKCEKCEKGE